MFEDENEKKESGSHPPHSCPRLLVLKEPQPYRYTGVLVRYCTHENSVVELKDTEVYSTTARLNSTARFTLILYSILYTG